MLSGFGVFALGRSHPAIKDGPAPGNRRRPAQHGPDGLRPIAGAAGRAAGHPLPRGDRARRLRQLGSRGRRVRDQVRAREHEAQPHPLLRPRVPRPHHGRASRSTVRRSSDRLRPADARTRPRSPGATSTRLQTRAARRRRGRLHRRADPGQGRLRCSTPSGGARSKPRCTTPARCSSATRCRPASVARAGSSRSSTTA